MERKDKFGLIADVLMIAAESAREEHRTLMEQKLACHMDALADAFLLLAEAERTGGGAHATLRYIKESSGQDA